METGEEVALIRTRSQSQVENQSEALFRMRAGNRARQLSKAALVVAVRRPQCRNAAKGYEDYY